MEILARVGLDQTVLAPTNLFVFLSSMAIMEGSDPQKKIESTYWNALSKNWMLWPFVQAVNFKFVPLQHRVLVVNVVSLGMCYSFSVRTRFANKSKAGTATSPTLTLPALPFPRISLLHKTEAEIQGFHPSLMILWSRTLNASTESRSVIAKIRQSATTLLAYNNYAQHYT